MADEIAASREGHLFVIIVEHGISVWIVVDGACVATSSRGGRTAILVWKFGRRSKSLVLRVKGGRFVPDHVVTLPNQSCRCAKRDLCLGRNESTTHRGVG